MSEQYLRLLSPLRVALLGVTLAGSCAVYEIPTTAADGMAGGGNGFGGLSSGDESGGSPAEPESWGGKPPSLAVDAGQAGANDSDGGGAGNGGAAGAPGSGGGAAGAAGSEDGESQGGNGGSAAGSTSCAKGWRNQSACDQCVTQTQPDLQACAVILDCYVSKSCGPHSCASTDQKCGPNVLREGAAAYGIAQDVYACMCK